MIPISPIKHGSTHLTSKMVVLFIHFCILIRSTSGFIKAISSSSIENVVFVPCSVKTLSLPAEMVPINVDPFHTTPYSVFQVVFSSCLLISKHSVCLSYQNKLVMTLFLVCALVWVVN
ncbi:hypothetical protein AX774_g4874 [Zancudomyces culisetae]|uniref:Uncharacterized protein n=1 Tax=Zancudomyces culisetae TaxID=1213189 RepID=A0A1R1PL35_ZANCU|nr:hypothetical protein AX774_g4874 [Zancudomyces culisetae]|eukprot:OMH81675.1 hypothetical protein AX774_g4874 [Zancudomyces culisetae]